jgi:predicted AAA+ superfamily ATPase
MLTGLQKLAVQSVKQRASSPKLQVLNTALLSAQSSLSLDAARRNREFWGRLVESSIGSHLINSATGKGIEIFYWRERNKEVDFVLSRNNVLVAIEVESGASKGNLPGMEAFGRIFKPKRKLLVGGDGISIETFLSYPVEEWLD